MSGPPAAWTLGRDRARGAAILRLNRPGSSQNSLDPDTWAELERHLDAIDRDDSTRYLAIQSGKPGGFCAGADLKHLAACRDPRAIEAAIRAGWKAIDRLQALPIPAVAVIHGVCLGGGLELALHCRHRIVVEGDGLAEATLGLPEVLLGLVPGWGALAELPPLVGMESALPLLLEGRRVDAGEAERLGLIDLRVRPDELDDRIESAIFVDAPATTRYWPPQRMLDFVDRAREALDVAPDDGPNRARHRLLDVLVVEQEDGPGAGREAAIRALVDLAAGPDGRASLEAFARRGRSAS